jgi:hypothetical protein
MPRYFFNFVGDECSLLDKEGVELTDVTTVRKYAHKRAAELAGEMHKIKEFSAWQIQIYDENGDHIINMPCELDFM